MRARKNVSKIVSLILSLLCFGMISIAQKPAGNSNKDGKILPFSAFKNTDIGALTKPGKATIQKDELEIVAGGADIWGTHDECYFSYQTLKGNFDVSVQVLSLSAAHAYTKAGIMARVDLDDNCQHIYYQVFPDNRARNKNNGGCEFQYREEKAGLMKAIYPDLATAGHQFDVTYPNTWIRLKRTGDLFEGYFSSDGMEWKLYATYTLKLPAELMVGLAVTAHDKNAFTTARFGQMRLRK